LKKKLKIEKILKNKVILVTGGGGSIGSAIVKEILRYPIKTVRVFDTDEYGLFKLKREVNDPRLRLLLGNILDRERVNIAGNNVDIVIHAAAVKNIEITEFNAIETIDVNINGTVNMIKMAMEKQPEKFLYISTDKAADNSTLYGTTKQIGERLVRWAGVHVEKMKIGSVRFGNVIETKGNVFEVWNEEVKKGKPLSITDPNMKRYFFHIDEAVEFTLECLTQMKEGEIFVPKMEAQSIKKLALKISKKHKIIGLRPGEKIEEILMTDAERKMAIEKDKMWVIKNNF
jgi:UDP-N-acetylglucosamine 4,6-dehydratase/5-epimerase